MVQLQPADVGRRDAGRNGPLQAAGAAADPSDPVVFVARGTSAVYKRRAPRGRPAGRTVGQSGRRQLHHVSHYEVNTSETKST